MGLKVASQIRVDRKVIVREPVAGNAFRDQPIIVTFEVMTNSAEDELYKATFVEPLRADFVNDGDYRIALQQHEVNQRSYGRQLLRQVVVGWPEKAGIEDASGNPLHFSPEALSDLLELPYAVTAIVKAYREAIEGKSGAKGN